MGGALQRPGEGPPAGAAAGRGGLAEGANIRELWAAQNPYSRWAASGCQSSVGFVLPRQQICRDQIEARRVARLFEHLEHIGNELPPIAGGTPAHATTRHTLCRGALLPGLLLAMAGACLPQMQHVWPYHSCLFDSDFVVFLLHTAAGALTYATMGPLLRLLSLLMLHLARVQGCWVGAQIVYLNGMLFSEERIVCSVLCAWAVNFSWWSSPDATRQLLWRPCITMLLLLLTNGLRKMLEFAFLASRLRTRFQSDVLSSAFERAAIQRLADCADGSLSPALLQVSPVLPDIDEPHAFERHTSEMLKAAFRLREPAAKAGSRILTRHRTISELPPIDAKGCAEAGGVPAKRRTLSGIGFKTLSTTMFVMQLEGNCAEIEEQARHLFSQLVGKPWDSCNLRPLDLRNAADCSIEALDSSEASLVLGDLGCLMTPEDAECTWQLLSRRRDGGQRGSVSQEEFVQAIRGIFERFHMLAANLKDYAAIWLVFSDVLLAVQAAVAAGIVMAMFLPLQVLRTICISVPTAFLGLSFVFGGILREVFESLVLILLVQPFDVGDRISLPDGEDSYRTFVVQKINVLTTEARDSSNQCVYLKNASLFEESRLMNHGRSLNAIVELSFELPASQLSGEIVKDLERFIRRHMAYKAVNWVPTYLRSFAHVEDGYMLCDTSGSVTHRFRLMHRKPWQNIAEIRNDATNVFYAVLQEMRRIGVDFRLTTQPVHLENPAAPQDKHRSATGSPPSSGSRRHSGKPPRVSLPLASAYKAADGHIPETADTGDVELGPSVQGELVWRRNSVS